MSESAVRAYAAERRFAAGLLDAWLAQAPDDRDGLLELAERLRLGENQFRDVMDECVAIAGRRQSSISAVLGGGELRAVLARGLGRNEAVKAVKQALRRLRYPQLSAAERQLAELASSLRLPSGVRVALPENLEGEDVTVTLRARSAAELRAQAQAVVEALSKPAVDEMFAVLGGEW